MRVREEGREVTGWLKLKPNVSLERGERLRTNLLKSLPKLSWMREEGRWSTGVLKALPKDRWVRAKGRQSIDLLNDLPKVR
jgi:hypothetical protein